MTIHSSFVAVVWIEYFLLLLLLLLSLFPVALDVLQAAKEVAETMLKGEAPDDKERL